MDFEIETNDGTLVVNKKREEVENKIIDIISTYEKGELLYLIQELIEYETGTFEYIAEKLKNQLKTAFFGDKK